jgi:hypothetical protein
MAKAKKTEPIIEDEVVETTISVNWDGHTSRAYRSAQPETVVEPEVTSEPAEDGGQEEA